MVSQWEAEMLKQPGRGAHLGWKWYIKPRFTCFDNVSLIKLSRRARSVQRRDEPLAATTAPLTALLARFRCAAPSRTHPEATDPRGSRMSSCGCRGVCLSEPCQTASKAGGISDSPVVSPVCRPALCLHDRRSPAGLEGSLRTRAVPPPSGPPASALSPSRSRIGT